MTHGTEYILERIGSDAADNIDILAIIVNKFYQQFVVGSALHRIVTGRPFTCPLGPWSLTRGGPRRIVERREASNGQGWPAA